jgi:membrane protein required for colicin V production
MHAGQWMFLDFLFAFIILVSIGFALTKGLMREIISLAALLGGFILATRFFHIPAGLLLEFSRNESIADFLGFLVIFLGCILVGAIVSFIVNRFLKAASLKWIDRLLGGVFGLLRGWAMCSILVIALVAFPLRDNGSMIAQSVLAPYLLAGARAAILAVPQGLKSKFNEQYRKVLQTWNQSRSAA